MGFAYGVGDASPGSSTDGTGATSGTQNIAEGSMLVDTSKKTEPKLVGVVRASPGKTDIRLTGLFVAKKEKELEHK